MKRGVDMIKMSLPEYFYRMDTARTETVAVSSFTK